MAYRQPLHHLIHILYVPKRVKPAASTGGRFLHFADVMGKNTAKQDITDLPIVSQI
jgi:hypothetical protein